MINLAILISGRGSNMERILSAISNKYITNVKPCIVISNNERAAGIQIAQNKYKVKTAIVPGRGLKGWDYDKNLVSCLIQNDVTPSTGLVCLAGFMKLLSPEFVRLYRMRILNVHPSLLPAFSGLHAQKQAYDHGVKITGCTVHFVDEGLDSGPIILQRAVSVFDTDTDTILADRILEQEHEIYPEAVRLFAENKLVIEGRRVKILDNQSVK